MREAAVNLHDIADDAFADEFPGATNGRLGLESVGRHQRDAGIVAGVDDRLGAVDGDLGVSHRGRVFRTQRA